MPDSDQTLRPLILTANETFEFYRILRSLSFPRRRESSVFELLPDSHSPPPRGQAEQGYFFKGLTIDGLVKSQKCSRIVIPVKTGIQRFQFVSQAPCNIIIFAPL
jgi:hypothetical protein